MEGIEVKNSTCSCDPGSSTQIQEVSVTAVAAHGSTLEAGDWA